MYRTGSTIPHMKMEPYLPDEMVDEIVSYLPVADLANASRVDRRYGSYARPRMADAMEKAYRHDIWLLRALELVALYMLSGSVFVGSFDHPGYAGDREHMLRYGLIGTDDHISDSVEGILNQRFQYFSRVTVMGTLHVTFERERYDAENETLERHAE